MPNISKKNIIELSEKLSDIEKSLDISSKKEKLKTLENESTKENLWTNQENAQKILSEINDLTEEINQIEKLEEETNTLISLYEELGGEEFENIIQDFESLKEKISTFEIYTFLSNTYDKSSAILSIHSGQGGVEANDWTEMLYRMYTMYFDKKEWKYTVTDITKGNETGISTVTLEVEGKYAYGLLKKEHGTHRLVRISPFNAQGLRQTSFAGVEVIPLFKELNKEIEIPESDIEFKAVRSSGPGGQNVNKTSTAVQITHKPTKITVHCSEGRTQQGNRDKAIQILKGKLWKIIEENRLKEISDIKGGYKLAGWGNQIRNYILHPYKLVKDLRTGIETNNVESVLNGHIDNFVEAQVRIQ